jgi:hypothetical protein
MKKLKLSELKSRGLEVLSREQMKNVLGKMIGGSDGNDPDCPWRYAGCSYNESNILECDYIDCHDVIHCGYQCMRPGDGDACIV